MRPFIAEAVPAGVELEQDVADWLQRQFYAIRDSIDTAEDLNQSIPFAGYMQEGMIRFFVAGPTGVEAKGFYGYHTGAWNFIV